MNKRSFRCIFVEDNSAKIQKVAEVLLAADPAAARAAASADFLLQSTLDLFCGFAPAASPYIPDGDLTALPWVDEYHLAWGNSNRLHRRITHEEIEHFAAELCVEDEDGGAMQLATFDSKELCSSKRFIVQGFAVETLLDLDHFLAALCERRWADVVDWFAAANSHFMEAIATARQTTNATGQSRLDVDTETP